MGNTNFPILITGMTCASCVGRVEKAIQALPDVEHVSVNLMTESASIQYNQQLDIPRLIQAVEKIGYDVAIQTLEFSIDGMTCASCVSHVEKGLLTVMGVTAVTVNLATQRASVTGVSPLATELLIQAVDKKGYTAKLINNAESANDELAARQQQEFAHIKKRLCLASIFAIPLFLLEMGGHFIPAVHHWVATNIGTQNSWYLQFVLASLILFIPGLPFLKVGFRNLKNLSPDMNSLVAVGTSSAYLYSVVATFFPHLLPQGSVNVYYEAAGVIVALILLGRFFESKAKGNTSSAIKHLIGLQAKTATVLIDGQPVEKDIADIVVGDILEAKPGERIALDGMVISGESYVDEAMISGEPVPVKKNTDAKVIGGTVNQTGILSYRVTQIGADTVLANIIRMVEQAQTAKLPIQALVDKITAVFVPIVMGLALLTFIVWMIFGPSPALSFALVNAVAVLIIACPCAMGLATPTSIMVGTGRAAQLGILFRKGEALQSLKEAKVVAVDKTGTLTTGKPSLTDFNVNTKSPLAKNDILALIAAVENKSEHPIARAIVIAAQEQNLTLDTVEEFESVTGYGVRATVAGHLVQIGADRYMSQQLHLDIAVFAEQAKQLGQEGKTPIYVAIDGQLTAMIAVADAIKPSTPAAIKALHQLGIKVAMITGDNQHTAQAIAKQLGIDEVIAEVLPEGKVDAVSKLQKQYGQVAYVGDGINDAPALAHANVGIAIGTGTDIAIEAADVVLMSGELTGVPTALALSQATLRNIKENLFWAFAYNAALIPVAAGVLYPFNQTLLSPVFAASAMALSSVFVLFNALRLRGFKPPVSNI